MNQRFVEGISFSFALAIGLAISTGYPFGFVVAVGMPLVCLMPGSRKSAFRNTLTYYLAGLWPIIPGAQRYIGQPSSFFIAVLIWACSAVLLSFPWTFAWTPRLRLQYLWRVPAATMALIIPPIGLIGFISPVTGAGYIFPGTGWLGLAATVLLPGIVLALARQPVGLSRTNLRIALSALMSLAFGAHIFVSAQVEIPANWEAVNTNFGDLSDPYRDFVAAQSIQQHVAASKARVVIFPESVVPRWSDATTEFWRSTLLASRIRGQIVAIGAGLPRNVASPNGRTAKDDLLRSYDFSPALEALKSEDFQSLPRLNLNPDSKPSVDLPRESFDNTLLKVGAESSAFYQRVPVPFAMWQPFSKYGVPLHLEGPGMMEIDGQRAAVLICYEQILTYPVLASMLQSPTLIIGINNTFWITHTPIPRYQASAVRAWAKLFHLPYLLAVNS